MWAVPQPRHRISAALASAVLLSVTVVALTVPSALGTVGPAPHGGTRAATQPVCADLETNAALSASVAPHYPNASLLPSESVAVTSLQGAWSAVCASSAFSAGYQASAQPAISYLLTVGDHNLTASGDLIGSLFAAFTLTWEVACPTGAGPYPIGFDCVYTDVWNANLTIASVAGPVASITSARFAQCDTPAQNQTDVGAVEGYYGPTATYQLQPTQPVAESEVMTIWGEICASPGYYDVLGAHPNATTSWGTSIGAVTNVSGGSQGYNGGSVDFEWDISWNAACPSNATMYQGYLSCEFNDAWDANLATDTYTGPTLQVNVPIGIPPESSTSSAASPGATSAPWWMAPADQVALAGAAALGLVAVGWIARRRRRGAPPP